MVGRGVGGRWALAVLEVTGGDKVPHPLLLGPHFCARDPLGHCNKRKLEGRGFPLPQGVAPSCP